MRLPVIQTCGDCWWCVVSPADDEGRRLRPYCTHTKRQKAPTDKIADPPSWCPLRTGPDEAELEALRAVAEAFLISGVCRSMETPEEWAAHARLEGVLRRLDEVRRG